MFRALPRAFIIQMIASWMAVFLVVPKMQDVTIGENGVTYREDLSVLFLTTGESIIISK